MKNLLTPAGIEPATVLFVAQHLNHCATGTSILIYRIFLNLPSSFLQWALPTAIQYMF